MKPHRSRSFWPLCLFVALLPTLGVAIRALADDDEGEIETSASVSSARKRVLAAMPRDPAVLINVTSREMPASPDILNLGKRGTRALERCLADNGDAGIRRLCAAILGRLGDRRALPALQAALDDWDPSVRLQVVESLAKVPEEGSLAPLLKLYHRKDEEDGNRAAILATLGALSSRRAVAVLREELHKKGDKDGQDLRPDAFSALWHSRHLVARGTLIGDVGYALQAGHDGLAYRAVLAAAELRSPRLVKPLVPLMEHPQAGIRNKAVYALGRIGDPAATKALLGRLPGVRDARMLNNIAFALERLDRKAFFAEIRRLIEHKQAIIRMNAAFVVGDVRRPEGVPLLDKALSDPSDQVRNEAIAALGKLPTQEAAKLLLRFVDDPRLSVREEAIYSIHALSGGKRTDLVYDKLYQARPGPGQSEAVVEETRRRAAIVLGQAGDPRVRDYLLYCFESSRCSLVEIDSFVRRHREPAVAGRLLLAWARGNGWVTDLLSLLRPAGTVPIAESTMDAALARSDLGGAKQAIDLLGDLGDSAIRGRLQGLLATSDVWLRVHTSIALSRLGERAADGAVLGEMENLPAEWLPVLATALGRISEPAVRARLSPQLAQREGGQDPDVALAASAVRLMWEPAQAFPRLLAALGAESVRQRDLAERYLRRNRSPEVMALLRGALAREGRDDVKDRLRKLLEEPAPAPLFAARAAPRRVGRKR